MSWQKQEDIYLVMWKSHRTGATLSDLRKTEEGLERLVMTLKTFGYKDEDIIITKQKKAWKYETKAKPFTSKKVNDDA